MLSKTQAKLFFLVGTALCSVAFLGLTVDTFRQIPGQTRQQNLSEEAVRGKHLWDRNNCMGCHTILGEGAYYAPELTKVYERRGETFIKAMLKDPEAMYPGQRKMVNYHFNDQEINDLTAFLKWIGEMDLNGFPPKPDRLTTAAVADGAAGSHANSGVATPQVFGQMCTACHSLNGQGGNVGPALDGVGTRLTADYLRRWIKNPADVRPDAKMAKLPLADADIEALVAFLETLK